jgi:hypothetical protein
MRRQQRSEHTPVVPDPKVEELVSDDEVLEARVAIS